MKYFTWSWGNWHFVVFVEWPKSFADLVGTGAAADLDASGISARATLGGFRFELSIDYSKPE